MRRNRIAQISIFVMFTLIIVLGIIVVNFNEDNNAPQLQETLELSAENVPIKNYMDECIELAAAQATYLFGLEQGFFDLSDTFLATGEAAINYYYEKGNNKILSNEFFEKELAKFMETSLLEQCSNFSLFTEQGYVIRSEEPTVNSQIFENDVLFDIHYPLVIGEEDRVILESFSYRLPFRIGHVLDVSRTLVDAIVQEPFTLDLTLFLDQDVDVSVFQYDDCNQVYILLDNKSKLQEDDSEYAHSFGVGFDEEYCIQGAEPNFEEIPKPTIQNTDPILEAIPDLQANVGQTFTYSLKSSDSDGDTVFFHVTGILKEKVHILSGEIIFTPQLEDIGIHEISVFVIDLKGGIAEQTFILEIQ